MTGILWALAIWLFFGVLSAVFFKESFKTLMKKATAPGRFVLLALCVLLGPISGVLTFAYCVLTE